MSYFTRYLQRLVKFWQCRKMWKADSASILREQSGFIISWKYCLNLCSLRKLKETGCEEVYRNLFETSSVLQVFKVGVSSVPKKVSCRKRLFTSKKRLDVSMSEWLCSWNNARWMFFVVPWVCLPSLSDSTTMAFYIYIHQNNDNQFPDIT